MISQMPLLALLQQHPFKSAVDFYRKDHVGEMRVWIARAQQARELPLGPN
jgi:hypothetical protein